jgi:rubrerythrin
MMRQQPAEIAELWETAKYREIASGAFYTAGQSRTADPGARALMKELAAQEAEHYRRLDEFQKRTEIMSRMSKVKELVESEYLTGGETLGGAGLQDTLIFAIKREQEAVMFYSRMTGVMKTIEGKELCQRLAEQELGHKVKLELFYENLFMKED